jgi:hypothetical protein
MEKGMPVNGFPRKQRQVRFKVREQDMDVMPRRIPEVIPFF